jgi:hypothetical protein
VAKNIIVFAERDSEDCGVPFVDGNCDFVYRVLKVSNR